MPSQERTRSSSRRYSSRSPRPLRNLTRLLGELWDFAREHKAWWIVPVVVILLLAGVLIVSVSTISPFIYSLF